MNIYEYFSYKTYLVDLISQKSVKVSTLSEIAGCNRSYFSQMINGKVQLTSDHIINLAEGLEFSELEKEYFITLGLLERSSLDHTKKPVCFAYWFFDLPLRELTCRWSCWFWWHRLTWN